MDPERILEGAMASLAPKMPAGAVFKRSECLARIRELQQTCTDATIVAEFVRIVSSEPEKYVEGATKNLERSSAPEATRGDQHMPFHYSDRPEPIKMHSSTPASPKFDHAMEGTDELFAERPRPAVSSKSTREDEYYVPLVVPPGSVLPKRKSPLRRFLTRILKRLGLGS